MKKHIIILSFLVTGAFAQTISLPGSVQLKNGMVVSEVHNPVIQIRDSILIVSASPLPSVVLCYASMDSVSQFVHRCDATFDPSQTKSWPDWTALGITDYVTALMKKLPNVKVVPQ